MKTFSEKQKPRKFIFRRLVLEIYNVLYDKENDFRWKARYREKWKYNVMRLSCYM